ncbi:recombinase family protein [Salsuginibacillus kocurii]|uniref:recombinase family protein n=1 Tax=Salsuginibacillus kocurii TaxID=427078 RepID=UPI00036954F1|nr:recombinase family protein [Salsuginibacillus kocurii]
MKGPAFIYARVSTEEQAQKGYSLQGQIEATINKAVELGYSRSDVVVYTDEKSGSTLERPGLLKLRDDVKGKKPAYILVTDPDRLARNLTHQLLLTDEWRSQQVELVFIHFEWKDSPEGMLYYQLRGMFAQYEREKIRERTIRGRLDKIKKTGKLSMDPRIYGYRFDTKEDRLVRCKRTAPVVQWLFQEASKGLSIQAIRKRLEEHKLPAPRGLIWYDTTIRRILQNSSYTGTYWAYKCDYHSGYKRTRPKEEQFPLPIPALVDEETFEQVQQLMRQRQRGSSRPAKKGLFAGLLCCKCGAPFHLVNKGKGRLYYICKRRIATKDCKMAYQQVERVEQALWEIVERELYALYLEDLPPVADIFIDDAIYQQAKLERARVQKLYEQGLISFQTLEKELEESKRKSSTADPSSVSVSEWPAVILSDQKAELVEQFVETVCLQDQGQWMVTLRFPCHAEGVKER